MIAGGLAAQEQTAPSAPQPPDYSRQNLLRLLVDADAPGDEDRLRFHVGAIEFGALGTRWRFNYLPLMMPLSGTQMGVTRQWPDPFALTGTSIASPPRTWRTRRALERELRRINRTTKAKVKVEVE